MDVYNNTPPIFSSLNMPEDTTTDVPLNVELKWSQATDTSNDSLKYDVYIGTTSTLTTPVQTGLTTTTFSPSNLQSETTYYWQVKVRDSENAEDISYIWSFTTNNGNNTPVFDSLTSPIDQSVNQNLNITLNWNEATDADNDELVYDVYFGTNTTFTKPEVVDLTSTNCSLTNLTENTTYYWQVKVRDNNGGIDQSSIWSFTTMAASNINAPQNLRVVSQTDGKINLKWDEVIDSTGYKVYKSTSVVGPFTELAHISKATPLTPIPGIAIHYKGSRNTVHYNADGNGWTTSPGIKMGTSTKGSDYKYIMIDGASKLEFCFNKDGSDWDSNNGKNYTIDQGCGSYIFENGIIKKEITTNNFEEYGDGDIQPGTTYHYYVTATQNSEESNSSNKVTVTAKFQESFVPYIGPYLTLISSSLSPDKMTAKVLEPSTSMVINYETDTANVNFTGMVYYKKTSDSIWQNKTENNTGKRIHHIELTSLDENTEYEYRIVGPSGDVSKKYTFKTATPNTNQSNFLAIGDMQDEKKRQRWSDVADAISSGHMDDFDFIICVGDMAKDDTEYSGKRFYWWKVFFDKGKDIFTNKPLLPTPGNHDTPANNATGEADYSNNAEDSTSFRKYFNIPDNSISEDYYSFTYGNASFLSINTEITIYYKRHPERDNKNRVETMRNWLDSKITNSQSNTWNFAFWHVPAINPAGGKDEVSIVRPYTDLFNGRLDWSITGHVHEYQRSVPLYATSSSITKKNTYGRGSDQGVGYLICAPAGQWPRNNYDSNNMHLLDFYPGKNYNGKVAFEIGFSIINLNGNTFNLETYGLGAVDRDGSENQNNENGYGDTGFARLIDSLTYTK